MRKDESDMNCVEINEVFLNPVTSELYLKLKVILVHNMPIFQNSSL